MTPGQLSQELLSAARAVLAARGLDPAVLPPTAPLARARHRAHGDYASPLALRLAGRVQVAPRELATAVAEQLRGVAGIASVEVAGPGFLNLRLSPAAAGDVVRRVLAAGDEYGRGPDQPAGPVRWQAPVEPDLVRAVQYAHARLASLLRNAADLGIAWAGDAGLDPGLPASGPEHDLLLALADFPQVVAVAAARREPYRVARYCAELAGGCHRFVATCPVLPMGDDPVTDVIRARLGLVAAARIVLANGLARLGAPAPDRM